MENKHTPGPWQPVYISGVCTSIGNTDGDGYYELVADMILPETDEEYAEQKETIEANAKLMAAAPEMLDVLDSTYQLMLVLGVDPTHPNMVAMNDVIKKATQS